MSSPKKKSKKRSKNKSSFGNLSSFVVKPKDQSKDQSKLPKQNKKIDVKAPIDKDISAPSPENKLKNKNSAKSINLAKSATSTSSPKISAPIKQKTPAIPEKPKKPIIPKKKATTEVFEKATEAKPSKAKKKQNSDQNTQIAKKSTNKSFTKNFFQSRPHDFGDFPFKEKYSRNNRESQKSYHLRILQEENMIVQELEEGMLLTVEYDGGLNKAFAKFYDFSTNSIKIWVDTTGHRPYCYHKDDQNSLSQIGELMGFGGFDGFSTVKKWDLLEDKELSVTKIYGKTPTDIGGSKGIRVILEGAWEANVRYHHSYIYDRGLIPGMNYSIKKGKIYPLSPKIDKKLDAKLKEVFLKEAPEIQNMAQIYQPIFSSAIPPLKRMAYDIEVEETSDGNLPDPTIAKYKVISVSFAATDGLRLVYCLDREDLPDGHYPVDFPEGTEVFFFKNERELVIETFRKIWEYPIVITFNGDNFDNSYLYHRARKLRINETLNPILTSRGGGMVTRNTHYKKGIHIDVFQFFANRSIKGYAFGGAYLRNSLDDISSSLLGTGKIKHEGTRIGAMNLAQLIHYNMVDSILTLELTTFNNNVMWNLLLVLMRITRLPMQDLFRLQISAWIKSLFLAEHRRQNFLVPRMSELEDRGKFSRSDDDPFEGAIVIKPVPGIHFGVAVLDFSSLYPSTIKTRNLSYETMNCLHKECKKNLLPDDDHWICTKKMGIFAWVVGFLRDVRVKYFKPLSNDKSLQPEERQTADVMASALKVFINGSYGVFGSKNFNLYFRPVAVATTALGRYSIQKTIDKSESMGVKVLYGDTDSVFLLQPTENQVTTLVEWSKAELDLELELEKTYQFLGLSERKKNYIGVRMGGERVDLKGLMVKKYNTPNFIKKGFKQVQNELVQITNMDIFNQKRKKIIQIVRKSIRSIGKPEDEGGFDIKDYAITVVLRRKVESYISTTPQHVKAIKLLPPNERNKIVPGTFITYVKTRTSEGVKPLSMTSIRDIDFKKYNELVQSTFEQVLDPLNISFIRDIQGIKKLESFF
ncbi:MAG: DNA-directed DNA polymerase I [Promethearchaeota archaeon]